MSNSSRIAVLLIDSQAEDRAYWGQRLLSSKPIASLKRKPAGGLEICRRVTSDDGGEQWTWEFSGYGGAQGWKKTLIFAADGVLKDFRRDYWPKETW